MIKNKLIPFSPPYVDQDVLKEVLDTLSSGWITSGPKVKALEEEICKQTGVSRTVCVNSWTSGAILILKWFGIKEGDEVLFLRILTVQLLWQYCIVVQFQ
jgi:dTDP-4-amino-4,6-dideoxygalactose transaminase